MTFQNGKTVGNPLITVSLRMAFLLGLLIFVFAGCQQSSDDGSISPGASASTTTITSANCTVASLTVICDVTSDDITFTAASSTIYYTSQDGSVPSVSTSSDSVASGGSIAITGTEGSTWYVRFFSVNTSGGTESQRTLTIVFSDTTAPVLSVAITSASTDPSSDSTCDCDSSSNTYYCTGPVNITFSANEAASVYYESEIGSTPTADPSSDSSPAPLSLNISANDTRISIFGRDTVGNDGTADVYCFELNGVTPTVNGGYYKGSKTFTLYQAGSRGIDTDYQIWYRASSGSDTSADSAAVFDGTPLPLAGTTRYLNLFSQDEDPYADEIEATSTAGNTTIYQYKYNIIYNDTGSLDGSNNVIDGSTDSDKSLVLYMDNDNPNFTLLPPSGGSLNSTISVTPFVHDNGHELAERYSLMNSRLTIAAPLQEASAWYCTPSNQDITDNEFWSYCDEAENRTTLATSATITITDDTYMILKAQDSAGNQTECYAQDDTHRIFSCWPVTDRFFDTKDKKNHYIEYYTPGMQQSKIYHEEEFKEYNVSPVRNFGHSIAVGNLDNDGGENDIVIGAPAYSSNDSTDDSKGAVYIWYNGFRERATLEFTLSDASIDISNKYIDFATDGNTSLRVYLDPNTTADVSPNYQAYLASDSTSDPYADKTQAKPSEIATVLNKAFLSSFNQSYKNHLYAIGSDAAIDASGDASGDGVLTIAHLNQTIQGEFTYSSNFDPTSDLYHSGNSIKAYDYKIIGESNNSEFGYSVAIGKVDSSTDTSIYSDRNIVVGSPGYASDKGAVYVVRIPGSDISADHGVVKLAESTTDAVKIYSTLPGRLGMALVLVDVTNDSANEIYVSAPYHDGAGDDRGAVYRIPGQDFSFSDTTGDVASLSDDSLIWAGERGDNSNDDETSADYNLFGFSLAVGITKFQSTPNKNLYIGVPGNGINSVNYKGRVRHFDLVNYTLNNFSSHYKIASKSNETDDLFGYSLDIVNSKFDTSKTVSDICPCLAIGSPGTDSTSTSDNDVGKVWLLGNVFDGYIEGSTEDGKLGTHLLAARIGNSDDFDTVFISSEFSNNKGKITILRKQSLTSGSDFVLTPTTISTSLEGTTIGDNMGKAISLIRINSNGDKGLVIGLSGQDSPTFRMGGVRIYSANRLGF